MPDLTLQETVGLSSPGLALGLGGVIDWGNNMVFLDLMNMSRPMYGHDSSGAWAAYSTQDLKDAGLLDADGWPLEIPEALSCIATIFAWSDDPEAGATRAGTYVLSYEGSGTLNLSGDVTILSQEDGRLEIALGGGSWELQITGTDPTDNIRDISIIREDHLELVEAGALFNPDYLAVIADTAQIRFMDWQETNNSEVGPGDLPLFSGGNWRSLSDGDSAPLDYMVALANQIGADPWFCIPHGADDAYIRAFAEYVRDNLDPGLTVRIEYSNETWNWGFEQTQYFLQGALDTWGDAGAYNSYFTMKAVNVAQIFSEVWAEAEGEAAGLRNVLGTLTVDGWLTGERLGGAYWQSLDPEGWVEPASVFDELAVTTYFGVGIITNDTQRDALLAAYDSSEAEAFALLTEYLNDPESTESVFGTIANLEARAAQAHAAGLELVAYEGGQHVHHAAFVDVPEADIQALDQMFTDYVRSSHMADLYQILWEAWAEIGDSAFMHFVDVGEPSKWGSWGLYSHIGDSTPRAELLEALNASEGQWWSDEDPGETYTQGRTVTGTDAGEILIGTIKTDFLLGRGGDDTLYGGTGDDGLHGGAGTDLAVFAGDISYYSLTQNADGSWQVAHVNGFDSDHMFSVEQVIFDDTEVLDIAEAQALADTRRAERIAAEEAAAQAEWLRENTTPDHLLTEDFTSLTVHDDQMQGVEVMTLSPWTALSNELGRRGSSDASYAIFRNGVEVTYEGTLYEPSYWLIQQNRDGSGGTAVFDSAFDAAMAFGSLALAAEGAGRLTLTDADDVFTGRSEFDHVVSAGGGDDSITGKAGDDWLDGGAGRDTLKGGSGSDTIIAAEGGDWVKAGAGWDYITAGDGARVDGQGGTDTVRIDADLRDVTLSPYGTAWTQLTWGTTFVRIQNVENIAFRDQTIALEDLTAIQMLDLSQPQSTHDLLGRDLVVTSTAQGIVVFAVDENASLMTELTAAHGQGLGRVYHLSDQGTVAEVGGTSVTPDYWSINHGSAEMGGARLADTVQEVAEALGHIVLDAGAITLTDGHDNFFGRGADDHVTGGNGWDLLSGSDGNDWLDGGAMEDMLAGGHGQDTLIGGTGDDQLSGGADADVFVFALGAGDDRISDFAAEDQLDLTDWANGYSLNEMAQVLADGDLLLSNGSDSILLAGWSDLGLALQDAQILL